MHCEQEPAPGMQKHHKSSLKTNKTQELLCGITTLIFLVKGAGCRGYLGWEHGLTRSALLSDDKETPQTELG